MFSIVDRGLAHALTAMGLSGREWSVMVALLHHGVRDDGEVGVSKDGYAMSSTDVAEYLLGDLSASNVRHILASLVSKGVLVRIRHKRVNGRDVTIHALSDKVLALAAEAERTDVAETSAAEPERNDGAAVESVTRRAQVSSHTPISTHKEQEGIKTCNSISDGTLRNADGEKERNTSHEQTSETDRDGSCDAGEPLLYYPYPTDVDEVMDYLESVQDIPGYDAALFMTAYPETVERFYYGNVRRGWVLRDGRPTLDWHYAVMSYAVKVARETCPGVEFSVPRERLLAERRASGQGGRW